MIVEAVRKMTEILVSLSDDGDDLGKMARDF